MKVFVEITYRGIAHLPVRSWYVMSRSNRRNSQSHNLKIFTSKTLQGTQKNKCYSLKIPILAGDDPCTSPIYILYVHRAPMTSTFEGQPPKTKPFPIKAVVIWVLGMYIQFCSNSPISKLLLPFIKKTSLVVL